MSQSTRMERMSGVTSGCRSSMYSAEGSLAFCTWNFFQPNSWVMNTRGGGGGVQVGAWTHFGVGMRFRMLKHGSTSTRHVLAFPW